MFLIFHVKCNPVKTHCTRITRRRETSENEGIAGVSAPQRNKNKITLGCVAVAFFRHPRIAHCSARI